jgi:hypothetical protein
MGRDVPSPEKLIPLIVARYMVDQVRSQQCDILPTCIPLVRNAPQFTQIRVLAADKADMVTGEFRAVLRALEGGYHVVDKLRH